MPSPDMVIETLPVVGTTIKEALSPLPDVYISLRLWTDFVTPMLL